MSDSAHTPYDGMAWFYNRYWGGRFLDKIYPVIEQAVLRHLQQGATILDLCCGTGQLAAKLCEHGYRVIGVDNSAEMLAFARQNASAAIFIESDARSFELPCQVDAAVSVFDSLNHIMSLDELGDVFRSVHAVLRPGGLFLFDLNVEEGFVQRWKGALNIVESDHLLTARSSYDPESRIGRLDLTMFRLIDDGWTRQDESFLQRSYTPEEISQALTSVGFKLTQWGPSSDFGLASVGRLLVVAQRPMEAELS